MVRKALELDHVQLCRFSTRSRCHPPGTVQIETERGGRGRVRRYDALLGGRAESLCELAPVGTSGGWGGGVPDAQGEAEDAEPGGRGQAGAVGGGPPQSIDHGPTEQGAERD